VDELLRAVALKTGWKGGKGGHGDVEMDMLALRMIQRWRQGGLGRFLLDDVDEAAVARYREGDGVGEEGMSLNQARKAEKALLRERTRGKVKGLKGEG
jgi:hypothetical protein